MSSITTPKFYSNDAMGKAKKIFLQEIEKRLPESQNALFSLESDGYQEAKWEILYKFAHTIKGSGRMVELNVLAEPAAEMATVLLLIKNYQVALNEEILRFLKERMNEIIHQKTDLISEIAQEPKSTPSEEHKILVVDDDPAITGLIRQNLESNGFAVTICHDTGSAEKILRSEHPDLMVLDILFPAGGGNGIEFCRKIRSNPQWSNIPVIFLSVKGELQDKLAGFSTGADDYLAKPFKVEELSARIQAILNRLAQSRELILQDELTKVYNRRYLQIFLTREITKTERIKQHFSLAMVDLDFFKQINDHHDHIIGDEVLQCLINKIQYNLRSSDVICRYGGDEFVIGMPGTASAEAYKVLERIRRSVAAEPLKLPINKKEIPLTVSIGIADFPQDAITLAELLRAADTALYRAKEAGRNNVQRFENLNLLK